MTGENKARLLALAERCEKASEGSRNLDADIYEAMGLEVLRVPGCPRAIGWRHRPGRGCWQSMQRLTTSLDAAMTLVPDGFKWRCGYSRHIDHVAEVVDYNSHKGTYVGECVTGNRSLALCASALRAAAEMEG